MTSDDPLTLRVRAPGPVFGIAVNVCLSDAGSVTIDEANR